MFHASREGGGRFRAEGGMGSVGGGRSSWAI
jgi:hypothetical protein